LDLDVSATEVAVTVTFSAVAGIAGAV